MLGREIDETSAGGRSRWGMLIIGLILLILAGGATIFFLRGGFAGGDSDEAIIKRVEKHILLPDEDPSITTVEKANELSQQAFFAEVKDGDKILIFPKSARILIYRPSENILVNVGPIIDDSASGPDAQTK